MSATVARSRRAGRGIYVGGRALQLDPTAAIGKGGEADVYDLGSGLALKLFKQPEHADYHGLPNEQEAALERLRYIGDKLRAFPAGLPAQVIAPIDVATDRRGDQVLGYTMKRVADAQGLLAFADSVRCEPAANPTDVTLVLNQLHRAIAEVHTAGVIVGDLNDQNVLVTTAAAQRPAPSAYLIDADSFQFGPYPCQVFSERFVDPLLCDPSAARPRLTRPYNIDSDWYAFNALVLMCLLGVGPHGGVYCPSRPSRRVTPAMRPLRRLSVFAKDVRFPRPATPLAALPAGLLEQLRAVFVDDRRGRFPAALLEELRWRRCPQCHASHGHDRCPACHVAVFIRAQAIVRGTLTASRLFTTQGLIVAAAVCRGRLAWLSYEAGLYRRENGQVVLRGQPGRVLSFKLKPDATLAASGEQLARIPMAGGAPERFSMDAVRDGGSASFASNDRHHYWIAGGRLLRSQPFAPAVVGEVLAGQTRFWAGPQFGFGMYRAGELCVPFVFDAARRGLNDRLKLPRLAGRIVGIRCLFDADEKRSSCAWLLVATQLGPSVRHACWVIARSGELVASADAVGGDGSWLGGSEPASSAGPAPGATVAGDFLFVPTDDGVVRIDVLGRALEQAREFPDTQPLVDAGCELFATADGLVVVSQREIWLLGLA